MAYKEQKDGSIVISGWPGGIAASPYRGLGDLKGVNISSIQDEVSLAYNRSRLDQPSLTSQTATVNNGNASLPCTSIMQLGTWVHITASTAGDFTNGNYYQVVNGGTGVSIKLSATFGGSAITPGSSGSITFSTVVMGVPVDYCVENVWSSASSAFRYYILDQNGLVWVSGAGGTPGQPTGGVNPTLTTAAVFSAITPHSNTTNAFDSGAVTNGSVQIIYATDSNNVVSAAYLLVFGQTHLYALRTDDKSGWPSSGGSPTTLETLRNANAPHRSILGSDQVVYFTDGSGVGVLFQKTGQVFDPTNAATFTYTNPNYLMSSTDTATRISMLSAGNGLSIFVGGFLNNLYIYPSYQNSTATGAAPTTLLWMPESNTQYMLQANNYVVVFSGSKGNIYLTNGSSVVPILTVPDYIAGSKNFVQDPYFIWGGAAYIRGRIFFSVKDQTASHTGNCGGVWSFAPSFSYYINQDTGSALRMEDASSLYASEGFNGYAPVLFAGYETAAQQLDGVQYVAAWAQSVNSIDISGTAPLTNSSAIIETDAIPVGTFLQRKTYKQIEVKFSSALSQNETITINYRTDLESAWASAGTINYDSDRLAAITNEVTFEKVQIIQLQIILNGNASAPSWIRIKEVYIR